MVLPHCVAPKDTSDPTRTLAVPVDHERAQVTAWLKAFVETADARDEAEQSVTDAARGGQQFVGDEHGRSEG